MHLQKTRSREKEAPTQPMGPPPSNPMTLDATTQPCMPTGHGPCRGHARPVPPYRLRPKRRTALATNQQARGSPGASPPRQAAGPRPGTSKGSSDPELQGRARRRYSAPLRHIQTQRPQDRRHGPWPAPLSAYNYPHRTDGGTQQPTSSRSGRRAWVAENAESPGERASPLQRVAGRRGVVSRACVERKRRGDPSLSELERQRLGSRAYRPVRADAAAKRAGGPGLATYP
jgi:hypothetical protein